MFFKKFYIKWIHFISKNKTNHDIFRRFESNQHVLNIRFLGTKEEQRYYDYGFTPLMLHMCNHEKFGWSLSNIKKKRQYMWDTYKPSVVLKNNTPLKVIPRILHKIWLTSCDKPTPLPDVFMKNIDRDHHHLDGNWTYILWGEEESFSDIPQFCIRKSPTIFKNHPMYSLYEKFLKEDQFGGASDILRLIILEKYGGVYMDVDAYITRRIDFFVDYYDFVISSDSDRASAICNSVMLMSPKNPIIQSFFECINDEWYDSILKDPLKSFSNHIYNVVFKTGPFRLTLVIDHAMDSHKPQIILPRNFLMKGLFFAHERVGSWVKK